MRRIATFVPALLIAVGIAVAFTDNGAHRLATWLGGEHCGCAWAKAGTCQWPCSNCCDASPTGTCTVTKDPSGR